MDAIGLNRAEVLFRSGRYTEAARQFPARLGTEAAGVVEAAGRRVTGFAPGHPVSVLPAFSTNDHGVYAERALVPAAAVVPRPDGLDAVGGAAYVASGLRTEAFRPVVDRPFRLPEIADAHRYLEAGAGVLFIGAHPDDEFPSLAAFGQWRQRRGLTTGVATVTRGEGGGNAGGPQEGAALGLIREREERTAVGFAGIRNVYHLDKPDFWYTLSAPLTARVWNRRPQPPTDTLERLVRLIRATTPRTVVTMEPRPFNQHGAHQESARLAIEAFRLAADPTAFPGQLTRERYRPWQASELRTQSWGFTGPVGPRCARTRATDPHTGLPVEGFWTGVRSPTGQTWAQVERNAARTYVTQGFGSLPRKVTTPRRRLPCEWFTVLSRNGNPVPAPVRDRSRLRPLYAEFRAWARRTGLPWLANDAQPASPASPSAKVPAVERAPVVDGRAGPGEYPGPALTLRHWEGKRCAPADCSATARISRHASALYVLVQVRDDLMGAALDAKGDCKRHWRTDSVEIDLDPRGASDDTSTTFKAGILPFTARGAGACAGRDGDNRQGPAATTAPGMRVASVVTRPYTGYTVEAKIPFAALPAAVDPDRLTANILVYDSDTRDRTGKSRLAWSPFGSAQADPYGWGAVRLPGHTPVVRPVSPPRIPLEAARSQDSPAARAQARRTGVPPAVGPRYRH
ncbi:PIG-L family deacetylase [Streptomyces sp. RS10V-4]|uniref:sugar-binding protein n=1 Tax=Streptomyces rhizoryzae TaxID=2932493 RepID=UPI00200326C8|nr:sugar-binding protein [Streptomyces rhizoryzae]MCK7622285.1 PIG-L family deacetylase [Streptomyces rhizoryzae]